MPLSSADTLPDQPSQNEPPSQDRLSALPAELQVQTSEYLDYADICHVRAASKALRLSFPDALNRLNKELSSAWTSLKEIFQHHACYVNSQGMLRILELDDASVKKHVLNHATVCGFSSTVTRWLLHPKEQQFACNKCRVVKPGSEFLRGTMSDWYQFNPIGGRIQSERTDLQKLASFECGECLCEHHPDDTHFVGAMPGQAEWISKCHKCHIIERLPAVVSSELFVSGFCKACFREINQDWSEYKAFLKDSFVAMERYEQAVLGESRDWSGLPNCPVAPEFVTTISTNNRRPLLNWRQFEFAQNPDGSTALTRRR